MSSLAPVGGAQWDSYFLLHLGSYPRECASRDHSGYRGYACFMPSDASVDNGSSGLVGHTGNIREKVQLQNGLNRRPVPSWCIHQ
jgi:hypothetical protein